MRKNTYTIIALLVLLSSWLYYTIASANSSSVLLDAQASTGLGSNSSQVQIFADTLEYHNRGNNSSVIGNYFVWNYYDSIYGNFTLNWSTNTLENVRIVSSTSACWTGDYGYQLGWYAYSELGWYIDFDYNDSIFVYYCNSDNSLRWYAYSAHIGYQNFAGISFDIEYIDENEPELPQLDESFTAPVTQITTPPTQPSWPTGWLPSSPANPQPNMQALQSQPFRFNGQTIEFIPENESFFYIIK